MLLIEAFAFSFKELSVLNSLPTQNFGDSCFSLFHSFLITFITGYFGFNRLQLEHLCTEFGTAQSCEVVRLLLGNRVQCFQRQCSLSMTLSLLSQGVDLGDDDTGDLVELIKSLPVFIARCNNLLSFILLFYRH